MQTPRLYERPSYRAWETPRKSTAVSLKLSKYLVSEWKFAIVGLLVSIAVISSKVIYSNRETIHDLLYNRELTTIQAVENGRIMFRYVWSETIRCSNIWLPVLCGVLTTYFTALMVYIDSDVPGVHPPSPFSPSKFRRQSGHTFHSNYIFAFAIGVMVTVYMYFRQTSL